MEISGINAGSTGAVTERVFVLVGSSGAVIFPLHPITDTVNVVKNPKILKSLFIFIAEKIILEEVSVAMEIRYNTNWSEFFLTEIIQRS